MENIKLLGLKLDELYREAKQEAEQSALKWYFENGYNEKIKEKSENLFVD